VHAGLVERSLSSTFAAQVLGQTLLTMRGDAESRQRAYAEAAGSVPAARLLRVV
jgi:hypothetical protein